MTLSPTPDGFTITYARGKCAAYSLAALIFATLMVSIGIDVFVPILDGTPLEDFDLTHPPPWLWASIVIAGGFILFVIAAWNGKNAFTPGVAMTFNADGVDARSLLGRRQIRWSEIGGVDVINGTVFLTPSPGSLAKGVPLQTFLTSVKTGELTCAMSQRQPELFSAIEETQL